MLYHAPATRLMSYPGIAMLRQPTPRFPNPRGRSRKMKTSWACLRTGSSGTGNPAEIGQVLKAPEQLGSRKLDLTRVMYYAKIARVHNAVPSLLLVLLGAWAGSGHSVLPLRRLSVWATSLMSCGVAMASMAINDYFDFAAGVDVSNSPNKPIPSGSVSPDAAVLFSSVVYSAVLCCACFMDFPSLRAIVSVSAGVTMLYTPFFKKVTTLKNATVAVIIALAPVSGALAAGADCDALLRLAPSLLYLFTGVMYREVLMDINDIKGDESAGVVTLPVMVGPAPALTLAATGVLAGSILGVLGVLSGSGAAHFIPPKLSVFGASLCTAQLLRGLTAAVVSMATISVLSQAVSIFKSEFSEASVAEGVERCLKPVGLAMFALLLGC